MRRTALLLLVVAVITISFVKGVPILENRGRLSACEEPLSYSVGGFDRRFGLSFQDFVSVLGEAEAIWESASGRELFVYDPSLSELPINLVYDSRQEVTQVLSKLGSVVERDEVYYESLEGEYQSSVREYENLKAVYDSEFASFQDRSAQYERDVKTWNSGKRSAGGEFERLEGEKAYLLSKSQDLQSLATRINNLVDTINSQAGELNEIAGELKDVVKTYNTIGQSRGETFTGGLYYEAEDGSSAIDIYEFSSRDKLLRILAHELGHALGLEHNDDPEAIMYYLNKSEKDTPTSTDLEELSTLCGT